MSLCFTLYLERFALAIWRRREAAMMFTHFYFMCVLLVIYLNLSGTFDEHLDGNASRRVCCALVRWGCDGDHPGLIRPGRRQRPRGRSESGSRATA